MRTKAEILKRMAEIRDSYDKDGADHEALDAEVRSLKEQLEAIEAREKLFEGIDFKGATHKGASKPEERREFVPETVLEQPEYRTAFLKHLQHKDLTDVEQRAFTTAATSAGPAIPTITLNMIARVIEQHAPLLGEINLMRVPGGVTVPVEDVVDDAVKHTELANITVAGDKLKDVTLNGYEIVKLVQISKSVQKMTIDAFETWLSTSLGRALANKATANIIAGTGTGEATGIDRLTWNADNSVTVAAAASLTNQNVLDVIGLLPGGFDTNAKFVMSKKTLFSSFMPLKDASKHDLVVREGSNYYVYGYPVHLDERIAQGEAILGDFRAGYYGNMPEDVTVTGSFDVKTNSFLFLGSAIFDGKVVLPSAFVKIVKGA